MDTDDDLAASLQGLAGLLTGHDPISQTLSEVARFAVRAIPEADGAGLTMLEDGRAQTVVASADFVREVDDIQYRMGEGPCVLAVASQHMQTSGSLSGEARWPRFGPAVGRLGVHSALSLPLLLPDRVVGALNVYARSKCAFGADAVRIGQLFAAPATVTVHNAQVLAESRRLADRLSDALSSRAVVEQARGILMSRTGGTADEALATLRQLSQDQQVKVLDIAQHLVHEAVRQARGRRSSV